MSSVYLTNTNTCCRISLCRKESHGVSVSGSVHGCSVLKKTEKQNPGCATAPLCTCLRAPLLDLPIHLSIYLSIHPSTSPPTNSSFIHLGPSILYISSSHPHPPTDLL